MFEINKIQEINLSREKVFKFFENPQNLETITPEWLKFKILNEGELQMRSGAEFKYLIKLGIFPMKWLTKITNYEPPVKFVDEQLKGPYKKWIHTHSFNEINGKTIIKDNVKYDLYGGPLKYIIHKLFVKNKVRKIFEHRSEEIAKLFKNENNE